MTFRQSIVAFLIMSASMTLTGYGMWHISAGEALPVRIVLIAVAVIINLLGMEVAAAGARSVSDGKYSAGMLQFTFALIVTGVAYFVDTSGIQSKFARADDAARVEVATDEQQSALLADARARAERASDVIPTLQKNVQTATATLEQAEQRRSAREACGPADSPATVGPICRAARQDVAAAKALLTDATDALRLAQEEVALSDRALAELGATAALPTARSDAAVASTLNDAQRVVVTWVFSGVVEFGAIFVIVLLGASVATRKSDRPLTAEDLHQILAAARPAPEPAPTPAPQPMAPAAPPTSHRSIDVTAIRPRDVPEGLVSAPRLGRQRVEAEETAAKEAYDMATDGPKGLRGRIEREKARARPPEPPKEEASTPPVAVDEEQRRRAKAAADAVVARGTIDRQKLDALLKGRKNGGDA